MRLQFMRYLHLEDGSVKRARETPGHVAELARGGPWVVMFEDSENLHEVELDQQGETWYGDCWDLDMRGERRGRCPGFKYNDGPCAHLFLVWSRTGRGQIDLRAQDGPDVVRADGGVVDREYAAGSDGRVFGRPEDQL